MVAMTFTMLTILSVINMIIMTKTFIVSDKLHHANRKFLGARVLLICSEVVPRIIDVFEKGTTSFEQFQQFTSFLSFLYLSAEQAEILKITVLNIACLATAIINFKVWKHVDIGVGLLSFTTKENERFIGA